MRKIAKRQPTQSDVAKLARVSRTTVSYILSNSDAISVPLETRQRVLNAAAQLGYVPDRTAQSLRTRKTYAIAGIIPDLTNPFHLAFEHGIQVVAERHGYDLMIYNTDGIAERERKYVRSIQHRRVDGMIGVFLRLSTDDVRTLLERDIAVVKLGSRPEAVDQLPLDVLYVDYRAAAEQAVTYLIGRGHRRIGMLVGHDSPVQTRLAGYRVALAAHDIAFDERLVQGGAGYSVQHGRSAIRALLAQEPRVTAVFAASDLLAMGALVELRMAGLRVPDDIAVLGFDDIFAAELVTPPLTTVATFQEQLGRRAAEMLLERLDGTTSGGGRCEQMPFELIVRESA